MDFDKFIIFSVLFERSNCFNLYLEKENVVKMFELRKSLQLFGEWPHVTAHRIFMQTIIMPGCGSPTVGLDDFKLCDFFPGSYVYIILN